VLNCAGVKEGVRGGEGFGEASQNGVTYICNLGLGSDHHHRFALGLVHFRFWLDMLFNVVHDFRVRVGFVQGVLSA